MMSSTEEYVCTLSKETLDKAAKELRENEETRNEDIQALREKVEKIEGVYCIMGTTDVGGGVPAGF